MKIEQLRYLSEAAKYKSISVAAEKNFISQPALSASLNKLERELGVDLLRRSSKGVFLTSTGEQVLEQAKTIFDAMSEIKDIATVGSTSGIINISSIPCFCDRIIPQTILRLKEQEMDVVLSITTAESAETATNVSSGISSLGIVIHHDSLDGIHDLSYTPLFRDEYVLYVGPFSPYWERESITLEEVLNEPYLAYRSEFTKSNGGLSDIFSQFNKLPNVVFRSDDNEALKRMIANDNYVAFFPRFMSRDDIYLRDGYLRALPVSDKDLTFEVGYVQSVKYKPGRATKIFLEVMNKTIDKDSMLERIQ